MTFEKASDVAVNASAMLPAIFQHVPVLVLAQHCRDMPVEIEKIERVGNCLRRAA
jgi:hypothetical protein